MKKFQLDEDASVQPSSQLPALSNEQMANVADSQLLATSQHPNASIAASNVINRNAVQINNENSPPKIIDYYIKRPKACNLLDVSSQFGCIPSNDTFETQSKNKNSISISFSPLQSYKQSWKSTHNHFQRYSDVKPREERRSTVVDLANQTHVLQKVNGWKIYHLTSQMEDLVSISAKME